MRKLNDKKPSINHFSSMKSTNDRVRQPESFCEKDVTSLAKFIRSKMDHF